MPPGGSGEASPPQATLAGACGTYCGWCLAYHGEIARLAALLLDRVRRQGFLSLAARLQPELAPSLHAFLDVLERIARTPPCPGCGRGGGVAGCPVRACCQRRQEPTCAGCGQLAACIEGRYPAVAAAPAGEGAGDDRLRPRWRELRRRSRLREDGGQGFPFSASDFLCRLTRKYGGWNRANLVRIGEVGLGQWLAEASADPVFRTVEKKTPDDVFGDG